MPALLVDSRTNVELSWDPSAILPLAEDPTSFAVDIYVYSYDYVEEKWVRNNVFPNHQNSGQATITKLQFMDSIQATCIHVSVGRPIETTSNVGQLVQELKSARKDITFPSGVGLWTGLLFSIENDRNLNDKKARSERDRQYNDACEIYGLVETLRLQ